MSEVNIRWQKIPDSHKWHNRIKQISPASHIFANNVNDAPEMKTIPGGTGLTCINEVACRVVAKGRDPTGLGRWVWLQLKGRNDKILRIVSFYRPCDGKRQPMDSTGLLTTYRQQKRFFGGQVDPRQRMITDLTQEFESWIKQNEQLVIMGDLNDDVRHKITDSWKDIGLTEVVSSRFPQPPPTYNQTKQLSRPIDGIWVSAGINVRKSGYLAFEEGCPSDHRMVWADLDFEDLFGCPWNRMSKRPAQRLKVNQPKLVQKYNETVSAALKEYNLLDRLESLVLRSQTGWSEEMEAEYNEIYEQQINIRRDVEKKLRKLKMGGKPWSPRFQTYRDRIELWDLIIKKRKKIHTNTTVIRRLMKKVNTPDALKMSLQEAEASLSEARKEYWEARKHATKWREDFLDKLAADVAEALDIKKESALKRLKSEEKMRRIFRKLSYLKKRQKGRPVITLYTSSDGIRREVVDKSAMEHACIIENRERFLQSSNTPFLTEPLLQQVGLLAEKQGAAQILRGTFDCKEQDVHTTNFISKLKQPDHVFTDPLLGTFGLQDHIRGWKKAKAKTISESHGLSFSHHIAALQEESLCSFDFKLRELPFRLGFSPRIWKSITDFQIYKKPGIFDVEEMRTITLYTADFYMNNKWLGQQIMRQAEKHRLLAAEQYGSRRHHKASHVALNQRLFTDLCRQKRQASSIVSVDAKSCYDRIIHNVASLCVQRLGIPRAPMDCMFKTLQSSEHHTMTAFGLSDETYSSNTNIPLQGVGQGNGAGPSIWTVINGPIIDMIRDSGGGAVFKTALTLSVIRLVCFSFVDDDDVVTTSDNVDDRGESLVDATQATLDIKNGGLHASGGVLSLKKCKWWLIDWKRTETTWELRTKEDMPGELSIMLYQSNERALKERQEPTEARECLGVFLSSCGSWSAQTSILEEKMKEFGGKLRIGNFTKEEAFTAARSMAWKKFEYLYPVTGLSEKQWDRVLKPLIRPLLHALKTNGNCPRTVFFGPLKYQGLGFTHPYYGQMISQFITLIEESNRRSLTGEMMIGSLEQFILELGTETGMNTDDVTHSAHTTDGMIKDLWLFGTKHSIYLAQPFHLPPWRNNDVYLMEAFVKAKYSPQDLWKLNETRLYMQAITLSDICDAKGVLIQERFFLCKDQCTLRNYSWPRTDLPSTSEVKLWQTALTKCFLEHLPNLKRPKRLRHPLGQWIRTPPWDEWYSEKEDRLYTKVADKWKVWIRIP